MRNPSIVNKIKFLKKIGRPPSSGAQSEGPSSRVELNCPSIIRDITLIIVLAVAVFPGKGWAEPLHVNLSSRLWVHDLTLQFRGDLFDRESMSSGYSISLGELSASIRRERVFAGFQTAVGRYHIDPVNVGIDGKVDITQFEVDAGYYVTPRFGPFIGYLHQSQKFEFGSLVGSQNLGVGLIGAIFNWPLLDRREFVVGKASLVGMGAGDVEGLQGEIGITHLAKTLPISYSIGLKYQRLSYSQSPLIINQLERSEDILLGINAGIHYTLR